MIELHLLVLMMSLAGLERGESLFFERVYLDDRRDLPMVLNGDSGAGVLTQTAHSVNALGSFVGEKTDDGAFKVQYPFAINGWSKIEEMVLKIQDGECQIGEGAFLDASPVRMVLRDQSAVEFRDVLQPLSLSQNESRTPGGAAFNAASEGPVSESLGVLVALHAGVIVISGNWVLSNGVVIARKAGQLTDAGRIGNRTSGPFRGLVPREDSDSWEMVRLAFVADG